MYNLEYLLPYLTLHLDHLFQFIQVLLDVPKTDDAAFLIRFSRLITGIDFSPFAAAKDDEKNAKDGKKNDKEKPVLKSNELYAAFSQQQSKTGKAFYDQAIIKPHIEQQMKKVVFVLSQQEDAHWKYQVVAAFTGALLSPFLEEKSQILGEFLNAVTKQLSSEHYYLRYFAVAAFPALVKLHAGDFRKDSTLERKPEDFKGMKQTLDEAFKYHFLLKKDHDDNYLKDPFAGIMEGYDDLEVT
jgi:hypothetical protein